ncbi:MAG: hypothetical protein WC554_02505 [Clostridia bacterium]|jgi:hypothetical protein|nr:hypothetical protein [Clostridia bacterium]NLV33093.1 hypothetical protein [Clostridiaceae bacterium]HPB17020.1 hypothetical protein [Clostridia bacterium]
MDQHDANHANEEKKEDKCCGYEIKVDKWYNKRNPNTFPYPVLATIVFLLMGFIWDLWHPGWIVFLTIPVYYAVVNAIKSRAISYTLIIVLIYLAMGFIWNLWHPGWIIFLLIPIIHWFTGKKG